MAISQTAYPNRKIHTFEESLQWSESHRHENFWTRAYQKAFPGMVAHVACQGDTLSQRLGIDRIIHLPSGKTLKIDEKLRDRNNDSDILLEFLSNDQTGATGWIEKDLQIDYLAYGFLPLRRVYLFPWEMLRLAWTNKKDEWLGQKTEHVNSTGAIRNSSGYWLIPARNTTYTTWSIAIPTRELRGAVAKASLIEFGEGA